MPTTLPRTLLILLACAAFWTLPAAGQIGSLPQELVRKTGVLTAAETASVANYVAPLVAELASEDALARGRARTALIEPLNTSGVSVAFQQAYTEAVSPGLSPLTQSESIPVRIAAVEAAGWLGTLEGWQMVETNLAHPQPGVRMASAVAARTLLDAAASRSPAINATGAGAIVRGIAQRLAAEPNAFVADGLVRTLQQGGQLVGVSGYEAAGRSAWEAISEHLPSRVFATRAETDHAAEQSRLTLLGTLEYFRSTDGLVRPTGVDRSIVQAAASVAGETLAMVAAKAQASSGAALDDESVRLGRMAYRVLLDAARLGRVDAPEAALAAPPEAGEDTSLYFRDARTYVLSLTQKFSLPSERFSRWFP